MSKKITKLEAASKQLETAIELFFSQGDETAIHTLAAAAYEILKDLSFKKRLSGIVKNKKLNQFILRNGPIGKKNANKIFSAANFFKHADIDPELSLEFDPDLTQVILYEACRLHIILRGGSPVIDTMITWVLNAQYMHMQEKEGSIPRPLDPEFDPSNKKKFLKILNWFKEKYAKEGTWQSHA